MYVPTISTRATNVELTDGRRALIIKRLQPLGKLFAPGDAPNLEVVLRKIPSSMVRGKYCVSVRLSSGSRSYVAMEIDSTLSGALRKGARTLRRTVADGKSIPVMANHRESNFLRYLKYSF